MRIFRRHLVTDRPLSCQEVGQLLQRYLDGETDDQVTRKVSEHLEDCRRCGLEADIYTEIKASLARQAPTLPDATLQRLRRFGEQLTNQAPAPEGRRHDPDGDRGNGSDPET